ncbi:hypothetical protein C922_05159, partial [Plasmodium inui San Antonio 1]
MDIDGYMSYILNKATKPGNCPNSSPGKMRACEISKWTRNENKEQSWRKAPIVSERADALRNSLNMTSQICKNLEKWASSLERRKTGVYWSESAPCNVDTMGLQLTGGKSRSGCMENRNNWRWQELDGNYNTIADETRSRRFRVCEDLVYLLIESFGLETKYEGKEPVLKLNAEGCRNFYRHLTEWGGDDVAEHIMNNWFTNLGGEREGNSEYIIQGKDWFEVIQEMFWGHQRAKKDIGCQFKGEGRECLGHDQDAKWCNVDLTKGNRDTTHQSTITDRAASRRGGGVPPQSEHNGEVEYGEWPGK